MGAVGLKIYRSVNQTDILVASVEKWKFQDTVMGEQFITCNVISETPIDWAIGDHCHFRGQTYTLNYIPTVTQKAPIDKVLDGFTYENVKFDSQQEELTRCMMLDITPTTGDYIAALGTNHTGSSRFQLYCGETTANGSTLTAVCALAAKMQANLDRLYPTNGWHIYVDTVSTYTDVSGEEILVTHTDSKLLTFDNSTVAQALGLVHTEFDLDYCVKGRNIYIGYALNSLTSDDSESIFAFGYGRGYPSIDNPGKGLFQIKQIANSQQKIVTRLRALGSTKNLPYNYYFKKYGLLSQSLFPNNLQLPGTFLPLGTPSDTADADGETKWAQNNARSQYLRKVLGDTNDSYIDKNDNAESCPEGIREDSARWDGSNGELPEIYPTIEGVTFGELRNAGVPDQTGATGIGAYQGASVQPDYERIDCLLAVGYTDNGVLIDDANIGDGIMPENEVVDTGTHFAIGIGLTKLVYNAQSGNGDFDDDSLYLEGEERVLFTVKDVSPGQYFMVPTGPSYSSVAYRFSISGKDNASANVGFIIRVIQKSRNVNLATWYSQFVNADTETGEKEMYLPELPDQATSGQVSSLTVTELSDIVVTFAPLMESVTASGQITLTYQVGRSQSGEYDPEYTWAAVQGDVASKYPFHVFIKDMGFDLTATFNGETPVMSMKSGNCVGREFQIGENVQKATVNGIRGYLLTLNRVEDSDLHTYYPNEYYPLSAGDYFVLLNINMPDAYIRAAELRLLKEATEYLADNCETKYTYQPSIDDIYLQRNIDEMELAGTPENSIFWRLYAGLKFWFNGIPSSADAPLPSVNMTIEQVTITMGESLTPKVEITLNDDVQQTTLQKLTVAVDRIYNGSIFSSGGAGTNMEAVVDICSRLFLSKTHDDEANGRITFNKMTTFIDLIKAKGGIDIGDYLSGFLGSGAHIGSDGRSEFEEVTVRGALRAAEFVFNRISAEEGEAIRSIGHGEILTVDETNCIATLKLEGDEWATIDTGDICRGLYNTVNKDYDNADSEGEDANGFRLKSGFFASYFKVEEIISNGKGECTFRYSLQTDEHGDVITEHPCPLMKFAVYGNTNNAKRERQSSMYITAVGIAPRLLFLARVNDWKIKPENIKVALGNIDGISVNEIIGGNVYPKTLSGDAGLFVEDNIYLGGIINQFTAADWDYIQDKLGQGINAQLTFGSDNIIVDALGNVVGGLYIESTDGTTTTRQYKLHTGVLVYDSAKKKYLTVGTAGSLGDDEFAMYVTANGCTVLQDGSDVYVTAIDNTANGNVLSDEQLEQMRNTDEFSIDFVVVTAGGWRTQMSYPVKITHLEQSYITFDLTNEMDAMAYRTQTKEYDGLPLGTSLKAYVNGTELQGGAYVRTTVTSDAFSGTANATNPEVPVVRFFGDDPANGLSCTITANGNLSIAKVGSNSVDMPDSKYTFNIQCVVKYAGVPYTSPTKRFTLTETTDATLYKLLLSANAISKDEGTYTPSSIDVKVQVIDSMGTNIYTPSQLAQVTDVEVWYLVGVYDPSMSKATLIAQKTTTQPSFSNVPTCLTVLAVDNSDTSDPVVLDVESVTINAVGRDGAGQPWVYSNLDQIVVDCDSEGNIKGTGTISYNLTFSLYWGQEKCTPVLEDCLVQFGNTQLTATLQSKDVRATLTLTAGETLESTNITVILQGYDHTGDTEGMHTARKTISVIANVQGADGVGRPGAAIRYRGEYSATVDADEGYLWNGTFRDCVKQGSSYYLVNVESDGSEPLGTPSDNQNWENVGGLQFVATELLLAENAVIDLLYSNVIKMRNRAGTLTATINEDQKGSYRIYYPSGNVMMEFSSEGFIYYYNDDEAHSRAWKLGLGGDISKESTDDWIPFYLSPLNGFNPTSGTVVDDETDFRSTRVLNYKFKCGSGGGWMPYDGNIYTSNASHNPIIETPVATGWYTPNEFAYQILNEDGTIYAITAYHITDGVIDDELQTTMY